MVLDINPEVCANDQTTTAQIVLYMWRLPNLKIVLERYNQCMQPNAQQVSLNGLVMKAHPIILNDDGTAWMLRIDQISKIFCIGFPMVLSGQKLQMESFQATLWHLYICLQVWMW